MLLIYLQEIMSVPEILNSRKLSRSVLNYKFDRQIKVWKTKKPINFNFGNVTSTQN